MDDYDIPRGGLSRTRRGGSDAGQPADRGRADARDGGLAFVES